MSRLLIIFIKNPILGKVKTRLAADIGDESALVIYQRLLTRTYEITKTLGFTKWIFYSHHIEKNDIWKAGYEKKLQEGADLGERMANAFQQGFNEKFHRICIIGSDCFELDTTTLNRAFDDLRNHDFVIGPANDGGYYLLGMKAFHRDIFQNKDWSTERILPQTIDDIRNAGKTYYSLPVFNDIDNVEDLKQFPELNF